MRQLRRANQQHSLLGEVSDLLRPQFTRYGEIWDIGQQGPPAVDLGVPAGKPIDPITRRDRARPQVLNGKVTAFKISPDGTRMALVRRTGAGSELGLARIIRSDKRSWLMAGELWNTKQDSNMAR